jgi:type IV pilus assembly protein PilV
VEEQKMAEDGRRNTRVAEGERGYTLLEVLIAISIFMVGILAIGSMQTAALQSNATSRGVTEAVAMMEEQMEMLMAMPWDPGNTTAIPALDPAIVPPAAAHTTTSADGKYALQWTTTNNAAARTLTVNLTVSWWESGRQRSITYTMLRSENL